jgi:hypothetical protein
MKKIFAFLFVFLSFYLSLFSQTGGPGQPEFMQFQQAGTSDLVNPATGTFSYQIPLFTIGGYAMQLTYKSEILMEDVASMVGLGWNLNAGSIVRTLRGLPDDFNGDLVTKQIHLEDNETYGGKIGVDLEIAGMGQVLGGSVSAGLGIFYNNYYGWGIEPSLGTSLSLSLPKGGGSGGSASLGMGISVNSQTGVDKYISPSVGLKLGKGDNKLSVSLGKTWSYNSKEGLSSSINTNLSLVSVNKGANRKGVNEENRKTKSSSDQGSMPLLGYSCNSYLNNSFQPDIDYPFENLSGSYSGTVGLDGYYVDPSLRITGYYSIQRLKTNTQVFPAYGDMYLKNGMPQDALMDYNTEKKLPYYCGESKILPIPYRTPDVFNLNAQGLSLSFSVNRNDIGVVGDATGITISSGDQLGLEANFGNLFKAGANIGTNNTYQTTGIWNPFFDHGSIGFKEGQDVLEGNLYQQFYFKNHGEINKFNNSIFKYLGDYRSILFDVNNEKELSGTLSNGLIVDNDKLINQSQPVRQTTINYFTAQEASDIGFDKKIKYHKFKVTNIIGTTDTVISRVSLGRPGHHLSEMHVIQPDGMRYIFGIPVYNTIQADFTFNVGDVENISTIDKIKNLVQYDPMIDNSISNNKGVDGFFEATYTPAYVTQFLITAVLSPDYRDVTHDGITEDDLGNWVKFEYYKEDSLYKWRTPYEHNKASYNAGLRSDPNDDKGSFVYGKKELWYIRSIESKTEIAIFYYSKRADGLGVMDYNGGKDPAATLRKLDSIKISTKTANNNPYSVPLKTIIFNYDYSLCKGIENGSEGKLTLDSVAITYEKSKKGLHTPYVFEYGKNPKYGTRVNPDYSIRNVNRWGYYQKNHGLSDCDNSSPLSNIDFPYSLQNKVTLDSCAYAWNLTGIKIPGGGKINVNYEAHDYAWLQDKTPGRMFIVTGFETPTTGNDLSSGNGIYFKLDESINSPEPNAILNEKYIKDIKDKYLYYKFYVNIHSVLFPNDYEYITGYAKVKSYNAVSSLNNGVFDYGYIELEPFDIDEEKPGNGQCNPILKTAIQFLRINRSRMIFDNSQNNTALTQPATFAGFIENLPSCLEQMKNQLTASISGINNYCKITGFCHKVDLSKSFIRLYNPSNFKIAGGARAKSVSINDNWQAMAGNTQQSKSYTTYYDYTKEEITPKKDTIMSSSGVADYEPMLGGDEISLKQPVFYNEVKKKAPDNEFYVEEPVNESLYPAPQIIYSKVTQYTNNELPDVGKTGKIVNEFYTSRDYPVKVRRTDVIEKRDKTDFNAFQIPYSSHNQQHDFATVSQGYSIELNNYSGLPKSTWVNNEQGVRISGEESEYFPDNNNFTVIDSKGNVKKDTLGLSVEYTINGRMSYDISTSSTLNANLNTAMVGPLMVPLFVPLFTESSSEKQFQSIVINKVIHRNALLKSKTVYSQTASVTTENLAFDEVTGEALLTGTPNEFNDTLFSFKYPAWWMHDGMGPAYQNIKLKISNGNLTQVSPFLKVGDELRIIGNRLWVKQIQPNLEFANDEHLLSPTPGASEYQVYWPGAKNLLTQSAGQTVTWKYNPINNPDKKLKLDKIGLSAKDSILNSSAIEYYDRAVIYCPTCPSDTLAKRKNKNDFVLGKVGNWKPRRTWFYLTDRTPLGLSAGETDVRTEGLFSKYNDFWLLPNYQNNNKSKWDIDYHNWEWKEKVNLTDADGLTIETEDRIGRKVASLLGYKNTLVTAQAYNSAYGEAYFEGFEDYTYSFCPRQDGYLNNTENILNRVLKISGTGLITQADYHSGRYCLSINDDFIFTVIKPDTCGYPYHYDKPSGNNTQKGSRFVTDTSCDDCIGGFYPMQKKKYLFSCWVKVAKTPPILSCSEASVLVKDANMPLATLIPEGPVIEGWQRIMGAFTTENSVNNLKFTLKKVLNLGTYYDDLRIIPFDGNMVSYVYDDRNLRLTYKLDENNYFTKYEYNNQGELIRIKKETEIGILTVKEGNQSLTK